MALTLVLMFSFVLAVTVNGLVFYPNGNQPISYQVPIKMSYVLNVFNVTKSENSTKLLVETAFINYNVIDLNGTWVKVNVNSNYTEINNISFIRPGNFTVNYALSPLNLSYPYLYPGFMSSSISYAIKSNVSTVILGYLNTSTNSSVNGNTYLYNEYSPVVAKISVFDFGVVQDIVRNVSGLEFNMRLVNYENSSVLQATNFTDRPGYLYVNLTYSNYSGTYVPSGYVEYVYPALLPGNILLMLQYNMQEIEGAPMGGFTSINGQEVNFIINVGTPFSLTTNFLIQNSTGIYWNSIPLNFVGNIVKVVQGTPYNLSEYIYKNVRGNVTFSRLAIYASKNLIVEQEYNQTSPSPSSYKLELMNGSYIDPNIHYPYLTGYQNTTLPFKAINPSESFTIAVVVTLVVVAILVILHKR
ncbi:hypothetical protein DFR87_08110 [Metallosphaera hakonensis JCM 8857 = DSM 7519]|uniref:Thermopsin n=2 Tax=Metallosphaera hakonensis TaxID=79601 RepID=A0A2U9IXP6_9CREN|nr:hypothetical protein DFR87_08110 [Metallosphaera hakonensis JCM 8857 = DSM 7519]